MFDDVRLRLRTVGGVSVVAVGRFGAGEPLTGEGLLALVGRADSRVVIDFPAYTAVSSAALGGLMRVWHESQATGGRVRLCIPPGETREVFGITKVDRLVLIYETLADALHDF